MMMMREQKVGQMGDQAAEYFDWKETHTMMVITMIIIIIIIMSTMITMIIIITIIITAFIIMKQWRSSWLSNLIGRRPTQLQNNLPQLSR